ncbi:hypothetical protein Pcinc_006085 [Petrolisthes cinctipes]|uniref:Uncharacterized protein n=1 Tax=Petrolisthes cinctipes TaxID=88211 RepID=A0AAE1GC80_PETCI|nr:hypothetical protein Pcinc_006085 [Petrolisthes cinctipes]
MRSHTQEVDYQVEDGLYDQGSPLPSTTKDVAGPSGEGKRKHGEFRNVDVWTTPLTEYCTSLKLSSCFGRIGSPSPKPETHGERCLPTTTSSTRCMGRGLLIARTPCLVALINPTPTMADPELTQEEEEEVGEQLQLPVEPKAKRRRIRPPFHSERMEQLHTNLLKEFQKQN